MKRSTTTDTQWESQEEEICQETLDQLECQISHLQEKEREWAEKIKQQEKLTHQLEERCRSILIHGSQRLVELQKQLQDKQLESERCLSELTNT